MHTSKLLILLVVLLSMLTQLSVSQTPEPAQLTHEKKVYHDANENVYVQKSLPLYLKFSTTPDGTNYTLKSKVSAKYTNPMYLDTEGANFIRSRNAVDPNTMKTASPVQEIMYEIYADGIAPYTGIKFSGAPQYISGGIVYWGKGLNVTLTSSDAVSGVATIHYALSSSSWSDYKNIDVSGEKAYDLYYYAHDNVGNAEKTNHKAFTVDLTSPKSSHEIVGIVYNSTILAPSTQFRLSSTDALSGVRTTYYSYDSRGNNVYGSSPVSISYLDDGEHTLNYYAVDNVKNEETKAAFKFYLDKIPPVVDYKIEGDQYIGNYKYISSRTKISMSATDNKAGVESISYSIDYAANSIYSAAYIIPDKNGLHQVVYFGTDNVKNNSSKKTLTVYMDNITPATGITYGSPQFFHRDTLFINKDTKVTLSPKDFQSGVQKTEYAIDGGSYSAYNSPFNVATEGYRTITFKAADRVNNVEEVKTSHVLVDNTAPKIFHNFSIEAIGTKAKDGKTLKVYPNYTRLYLGATDRHTGTAQIWYSLDGKTFKDYSSPYTLDISELSLFKQNQFYSVTVRSKDKLGNQSEEIIEFYVGKGD